MLSRIITSARSSFVLLTVFSAVAVCAVFFFSPSGSASPAVATSSAKPPQRIAKPNYDIRLDKGAIGRIAEFRARSGKKASQVSDLRESMIAGERKLRSRAPSLKVEYNDDLQVPEVIGPDVKKGKHSLSVHSGGDRPGALKRFLTQNQELVGLSAADIDLLKTASDDQDANGLSVVELRQEINGIPVFRGTVKAGFTKGGELVRVINNLAPDVDDPAVTADFGDPIDAVSAAAISVGDAPEKHLKPRNEKASRGNRAVFGDDDSAAKAEKVYFPTEPGVVVPAWQVLLWRPSDAYYVVVDAATGTTLWRKNITDDQSQAATYGIYANPNAFLNAAHNPFPFSPGPFSPNGSQGSAIARSAVTRVGNEAPYTFNNLGWIADGDTKTDGNNVQAGLDRDGTDGIDPNSEALSPTRNFTFNFAPLDPNTNVGELPIPATQTYPGTSFQQGSITQLFYLTNIFHDEMYRLGFDEAAGNFQNTNFTGQGLGGDRIRAESQDSSGTNNANFSTPSDGERGRMQMYIFTGANPDIDGSLDADVVVHELMHGVSNRLHGNSLGLLNDMSRSMGEGWSDFFGMAMLSQPTDPIDGIYTTGAYVTYMYGGSVNNSYYGIRRFPTAIMSSVGGPNNRPHDPLTFADIDSVTLDLSDGAFAPRTNSTPDEVHNGGEIWCSALWEIRARMITRLGWAEGNKRVMQLVINGMKLAPLSPTFVSERDAIIAAAVAGGTDEDVADIWAGFALRGLGAGASIQNVGGNSLGGTGTTRVTEAFDLPNLDQTPYISISDSIGDNDGFPEPGETVSLSIPLTNSTGTPATAITANVVGGGSAVYGTLDGTATTSRDIPFVIPPGATCGSTISVTINVDSSKGLKSFVRQFFVGNPTILSGSEQNFDGVAAPALPAGWTAAALQNGVNFVNTSVSPDTPPNSMFAADPSTVGGGTDLTSPPISVSSASSTVSFRHNYNTEAGWDGGVLEISVAGSPYQDIVLAGGSFVQGGYNAVIKTGKNNPFASRPGWTGNSNGYVDAIVQLPANANGKVVQLKWRFGADDNTAVDGWRVDSISMTGAAFIGGFECGLPSYSISGQVTTPEGAGLRNAVVNLIDAGGSSRRVLTSSMGYYSFTGVPPAPGYILRATSKRYRFSPVTVDVNADLTGVDLAGLE